MASRKRDQGGHAESNGRRAAVYVRVSTPGQEQDGTSLDTQEASCREYAILHGYTVEEAHVYREVHTGTELWERPQLTRLREAVRRREVGIVVAHAIDRLSRDPVHLGVILSEADHAGVEVVFVSEPLDNTPEGQLIRFVRGYAAKIEHAKIVERGMRGKRARTQSGKLLPGWKPLYGYRWNGDRTAYEIDPLTSPVVRRIYQEALQGRTLWAITAGLMADGIPRPSGPDHEGNGATDWGRRTVWLILTNPAYMGEASAWKRTVALPAGVVPPLVTPQEFAAVQERLKLNKRTAARNNRNPEIALLRGGYVRCGYCGWTMHVVYKAVSRETLPVYRCGRAQKPAPKVDCQHHVAVHVLDGAVWSRVASVLLHPETIAAELERMRENDPTAADLASVERHLTAVVQQQRNYIENLGNVSGAAATLIVDKINSLDAQRTQLVAEQQTILARAQGWQRAQGQLSDIQAWCRTVAANLAGLTYQDKRLALDALGVQVLVWRADHQPRWDIRASIPLDPPIACTTLAGATHNNAVVLCWTNLDAPVVAPVEAAVGVR